MYQKMIFEKKSITYALALDRIVYLEKNLRKIKVYYDKEVIEFYGTFEDVNPFLDNRFMHCHRSYVINMDKIKTMENSTIYLEGDLKIGLGQATFGKARKAFRSYKGRLSEESGKKSEKNGKIGEKNGKMGEKNGKNPCNSKGVIV